MDIRYIQHKHIDKKRWDRVVEKSPAGRLYGYSWYLDVMCEGWDALVYGDYEFIFPLPVKIKYGIVYSTMPYFMQQFDIYGSEIPTIEMYRKFLLAIPSRFRYIVLSLNTTEELNLKGWSLTQRINYELDLDRPYEQVWKKYRADIKNKLRKKVNYFFENECEIEDVVRDYRSVIGERLPGVKDIHYKNFIQGMQEVKKHKRLELCKLSDEYGNRLVSGVFPLVDGRMYHLLSAQTEAGRSIHANDFFIDSLFQEFSGRIKVFDFEGSNIPSVACFFRKWGSVKTFYSCYECKRFPINILK